MGIRDQIARRKVLFFLILPVVLLGIFFLCFTASLPVVNIAGGKHPFYFSPFSDSSAGGNSTAHAKLLSNNNLVFEYRLKKGYAWPYAGLYFTPAPGSTSLLFGKNILRIQLNVKKTKILPITISEFIPGYFDSLRTEKFRNLSYFLKLIPGETTYSIPLSYFKVAEALDSGKQRSPEIDPKRIKGITLQNCTLIHTDTPDEIRLSYMAIEGDYAYWFWGTALISTVWILGGSIILSKRKKTAVFIPYIPTDVKSAPNDEWSKIQHFISTHYMENIDMGSLEKELGIARHKIASILKENTSLIFKQYLNQTRVAEASRLLQETDLPIGEIADQTGFGHISNFNRVFKEYQKKSPSELRKNANS